MNVTIQAEDRLEVNVMRVKDIEGQIVVSRGIEKAGETTWKRFFVGNVEIVFFEGDPDES